MESNGVNSDLINRTIQNAIEVENIDLKQESLKIETVRTTKLNVAELNKIYGTTRMISKFGRIIFKGDKQIKQSFTFSYILENLNYSNPKEETTEIETETVENTNAE